MHRSITLSEIVSSTFSNNADPITERTKKQTFKEKLGIGLVEFLVCSLYQCYGILLAEYVQIGEYSLQKAIWTMIVYMSAWHITASWSQTLIRRLERTQYFQYRIVIGISTIVLAVGIAIPPHYFCYGIFGGIFSNLIYTQLKHVARKKCKTTEKTFEANIQLARAISLLVMPHIVLLLITNFSLDRVTIIYSAIILNIIPATLVIKLPEQDLFDLSLSEMNRYQTLPAFSQQVKEMKIFSTSGNTSDINYSNKRNNYDSKDEEESEVDSEEDEENDDLLVHEHNYYNELKVGELPPPAVPLIPNKLQLYYSQAGVSILPEIPEEEEGEEEKNINVIDLKRLSRISFALEEINNEERKVNLKDVVITENILVKPEPIQKIEYIPNYTENKGGFIKDMKFIKKNHCCSCSPYTLFVWKRRIRSWKDFLIDYVFNPIFTSIGDIHFYPTLISKLLITVGSVSFMSLIPYVALQKNDEYGSQDMAFLLSYTAFSWCLSLVMLPLLMGFSAVKLRITFIGGLILSSCSMLLLTKRKMSNDFIIWSSLLFGFGYGLTQYSESFVYKAFTGRRKYTQFEWTLNFLTGIIMILLYYFVYINNIDPVAWFSTLSFISYLANALIWSIAPVMKEVIIFLFKYFRRKSDGSSIF